MGRNAGNRTFLVECFAESADEAAVDGARASLDSACTALRAAGSAIDYLGALLVPEDELVLHFFAAPGFTPVREATRLAAIRVERIVESVVIAIQPDSTLVVPGGPGGRASRGEGPTRRA